MLSIPIPTNPVWLFFNDSESLMVLVMWMFLGPWTCSVLISPNRPVVAAVIGGVSVVALGVFIELHMVVPVAIMALLLVVFFALGVWKSTDRYRKAWLFFGTMTALTIACEYAALFFLRATPYVVADSIVNALWWVVLIGWVIMITLFIITVGQVTRHKYQTKDDAPSQDDSSS